VQLLEGRDPRLCVTRPAARHLDGQRPATIDRWGNCVSLTHSRTDAMAFVVAIRSNAEIDITDSSHD